MLIILLESPMQHHKRSLVSGSDKYSKITHKDKILLLKSVALDSKEIKQTAEGLNINYSTAKTLMRKFKKSGEHLKYEVIAGISRWYDIYSCPLERCSYRILEPIHHKNSSYHLKRQEETTESKQEEEDRRWRNQNSATPIDILQQVLFKQ